MTTLMREKFFNFNIGHLLTLVAILASGVGVYSASTRSDQRQESRLEFIDIKLADHAATLALHTDAIAKLDKLGTTKSATSLANDAERIASLQRTVAEHDIALRQIGVMANDLAWIKGELLRRRERE